MRNFLLGSVAALGLVATGAQAADLPRRAAPPAPVYVAPIFTWTGFYVGAQIGGGWGRSEIAGFSYNANGVVGGLHAGYNAQFNSFVVGVEGDIEATSLRGSTVVPGPVLLKTRAPWQGSLRARAGVAFDRALIYVTGGVAFANLKHEVVVAPFAVTTSTTRAGWTLGAGVEYAINNNWSVRAEYRYTDYGRHNIGFPFVGVNTRFKENAVRVGLSYRFGGAAGPVVAKY